MEVNADMARSSVLRGALDEVSGLVGEVAEHLEGRETGASLVLEMSVTIERLGYIRERLAVCQELVLAASDSWALANARRSLLEVLFSIIHLGGAEFYRVERTEAHFARILEGGAKDD